MNYRQYKAASTKHLKTCEFIIENINNANDKLNVLRNAYYLSGYSLECIVNFWIFELLKQNGQLTNPNNIYDNTNYPIHLGSGKKLVFAFNRNIHNRMTYYWFNQHDFKRNIEVFNYLADGDLLKDIPLIGDITNTPFPNMIELFEAWDVYNRYQNHPTNFPYQFSTNSNFIKRFELDISNFVKTIRLIFNELNNIQFGN